MSELYKRIEELCKKQGITITEMCRRAGIPRANLTELKMGRQQTLGTASLEKIAAYFEINVGSLIATETEKAPDSEEPREEDLRYAMFGGAEVSDEAWEKVKAFARFAAEEDRKRREGS